MRCAAAALIIALAACAHPVVREAPTPVPAPAPIAPLPVQRVTIPLDTPTSGDALIGAPVKILGGCSVYAWRLRADSLLRLSLADCTPVPPPAAHPRPGDTR